MPNIEVIHKETGEKRLIDADRFNPAIHQELGTKIVEVPKKRGRPAKVIEPIVEQVVEPVEPTV